MRSSQVLDGALHAVSLLMANPGGVLGYMTSFPSPSYSEMLGASEVITLKKDWLGSSCALSFLWEEWDYLKIPVPRM